MVIAILFVVTGTALQVSHHPPVTALHATDEKENIEIIWCQHPAPKFYGTHLSQFIQVLLLNFETIYIDIDVSIRNFKV